MGRGGEGEGRRGEEDRYTVGMLGAEQTVRLTFAFWLTASPPAATWRTLATAIRIMYWLEGGGGEGRGRGKERGRGREGGKGIKYVLHANTHIRAHTACAHALTASSLQESTNLECIETGMSFQPLPI